MKKAISLFLALTLCLALAAPALAADSEVIVSPQNLAVDGKTVDCEKYNIGGSNYFKLRDMAALLVGTPAAFSIDFFPETNTVVITRGGEYERLNTDLQTGEDNSATCVPSVWKLIVDGVPVEVSTYNIGGSNFYKLRDMGDAIGFAVDYAPSTNTALIYSDIEHTAVGLATPFFESFPFSAPAETNPKAVWYLSDGSDATGASLVASAPVITRKNNGDGTVTYHIEDEVTGRIESAYPEKIEKMGLKRWDYALYDYYSGAQFKSRAVYNSDSFESDFQISVHGEVYPVTYRFRTDDLGSKFDLAYYTITLRYNLRNQYEVTVSAEYDGLVMAVPCNSTTILYEDYPHTEPETQTRKMNKMSVWNDFDNVNNWVFIRVADYAQDV